MSTPDDNPYAAPQAELTFPPAKTANKSLQLIELPVAESVYKRQLFPTLSTYQLQRIYQSLEAIRLMNGLYYIIAYLTLLCAILLLIGGIVTLLFQDSAWKATNLMISLGCLVLCAIYLYLIYHLQKWTARSRYIGLIMDGIFNLMIAGWLLILFVMTFSSAGPVAVIIIILTSMFAKYPMSSFLGRYDLKELFGANRMRWELIVEEYEYRTKEQIP